MASVIEATKYKAATCQRQVERLAYWLDMFDQAEAKSDAGRCRHLVELATGAGLLTKGEALRFYRRTAALSL